MVGLLHRYRCPGPAGCSGGVLVVLPGGSGQALADLLKPRIFAYDWQSRAESASDPRGANVPTYQYSCTECGHFFEQFQSFSEDALTVCPQCAGRLRKVFNAVGVVFKGSGFYRTDSRSGADKGGDKGGDKGTEKTGVKAADKKGDAKSGGASKATAGSGAAAGAGSAA